MKRKACKLLSVMLALMLAFSAFTLVPAGALGATTITFKLDNFAIITDANFEEILYDINEPSESGTWGTYSYTYNSAENQITVTSTKNVTILRFQAFLIDDDAQLYWSDGTQEKLITANSGIYSANFGMAKNSSVTIEATVSHTVSWTNGNYSIEPVSGFTTTATGSATVKSGSDFTFKVINRINDNPVVVKAYKGAEQNVLTASGDGVYTLHVDADYDLIVTEKNYTISAILDEGSGVRYTTTLSNGVISSSVAHGSSYSFTVSAAAGYNPPTVTYTVGDAGPEQTPNASNGSYTISNIQGDIHIKVTSAEDKITYPVQFQSAAGRYTFVEEEGDNPLTIKDVPYGGSIRFKVKLDDAYSQSEITVMAGGMVITPNDGVYELTNVTSATQVIVNNGVTRNTYEVEIQSGAGYSLSQYRYTVSHGSNLTFTVTFEDRYVPVTDLELGDGVSVTTTGSGNTVSYTLTGVTKNITVRFNDLKVKAFTVEDKSESKEGYTLTPTTQGESVTYGADYIFTVGANPGYKLTSVGYRNADSATVLPVDKDTTGRYVITNITANKEIVIVAEKVVLKVNYRDALGTNETVEYKVGESGVSGTTVSLKTPETHTYFEFQGWFDSGNGENKIERFELANADAEITVEAVWTFTDSIFNLTLNVDRVDGSTTVKWHTVFSLAEDAAETDLANAGYKIVEYGMLYGATEEAAGKYANGGNDAASIVETKSDGAYLDSNTVILYKYQVGVDYDGELLVGNTYDQSFRYTVNGNRSAVTWIIVEDAAGERHVIFSDAATFNTAE